MSKKSEVFVLDVLMKNEAKYTDMIDIMSAMQGYLGEGYHDGRVVACGGDHLTVEDWHALVCLLKVNPILIIIK